LAVIKNREDLIQIGRCLEKATPSPGWIVAGVYSIRVEANGATTSILVGSRVVKTANGSMEVPCDLADILEAMVEHSVGG
jgi:hypothetical protein